MFFNAIFKSFKVLGDNIIPFFKILIPFYFASLIFDYILKTPTFCFVANNNINYLCATNPIIIFCSFLLTFFFLVAFCYNFIRKIYGVNDNKYLKFDIKFIRLFTILVVFAALLLYSPYAFFTLVDRAQDPSLQQVIYFEIPIYIGLVALSCSPFLILRVIMIMPEIILSEMFSFKKIWNTLNDNYINFIISFMVFIILLLILFLFPMSGGSALLNILGSLVLKFFSFCISALVFIYLTQIYSQINPEPQE